MTFKKFYLKIKYWCISLILNYFRSCCLKFWEELLFNFTECTITNAYKYAALHIQQFHRQNNDEHFINHQKDNTLTYHSCSCGCGLCCHCCLIDLLLTGFDFGLQVCRRVKILALLPGTATLDVVHANSDSVIRGVNHWAVTGMSKAAIRLPSCTVSSLKLTTHLRGARGVQLLNV